MSQLQGPPPGRPPARLKMYIAGQWQDGSGETFEVRSPATGELLSTVPVATAAEIDRAVQAARAAQAEFALWGHFERAALCHRIADEVEKRKYIMARDLSLEQGKPYLAEALPEIEESALNFRLAAEDIIRAETPLIPSRDRNKRILTFRAPYGVWAVITPWNFPFIIPSEYFGPGLACGNAIIAKPSPYTPITMYHVAACMEAAGVPAGLFQVVYGHVEVGQALVGHPGIDAVGFTGQPPTGLAIARQAGLKKLLLELGGNGPHIVLDDADLEKAARDAAFGAYFNAGQVCCATERILVHGKVADEFTHLVVEEFKKVTVGNPLEDVKMGPLNNEVIASRMDQHLQDAVAKGAQIRYGGKRIAGRGTNLWYEPTVVAGVTEEMLLNTHETFGPVAPILTFSTDDEAVRIANGTIYGLQMAVSTSSIKRAMYFMDRLQTGNLVINDTTDYWEAHEPFGGGPGRQSGYGRLGGRYTMDDMSLLRTVVLGG